MRRLGLEILKDFPKLAYSLFHTASANPGLRSLLILQDLIRYLTRTACKILPRIPKKGNPNFEVCLSRCCGEMDD